MTLDLGSGGEGRCAIFEQFLPFGASRAWQKAWQRLDPPGFGRILGFDFDRGGYFSLPDIPPGAYPISFKSGLRGVVYDMDVTDDRYADAPKLFRRLAMANRDRRFIGLPSDVPRWFEDRWSTCRVGTEEERDYIVSNMPEGVKREMVGARLDAICFIEIEGDRPILRGLIYSVPA